MGEDGRPRFVMELVRGRSVEQLLTDFGIAALESDVTITCSGMVLGTPARVCRRTGPSESLLSRTATTPAASVKELLTEPGSDDVAGVVQPDAVAGG